MGIEIVKQCTSVKEKKRRDCEIVEWIASIYYEVLEVSDRDTGWVQ